jgi:carbamoyl-phosphate synthase small subunit
MTGYQEIFTDPSYAGQIVVLTNTQIGNYGTNIEDNEATKPYIEGLVVREFSAMASNWRSDELARTYLEKHSIPVVSEIDTRALVRHLRTRGVMRGVLSGIEADAKKLVEKARGIPTMAGLDLASRVSTTAQYPSSPLGGCLLALGLIPRPPESRYHVVAYDFGIKQNILRRLAQVGCHTTVVPALTSADDVLALKPDGVFLSNGPGDPEPLETQVGNIRKLVGKVPIFGIWAISFSAWRSAAKTYKLKFGHRAPTTRYLTRHAARRGSHRTITGSPWIAIPLNPADVELTHVNLNDETLEGFRHRREPVFCVQYHPEAAPGPHDSHYLFDDFVKLMADQRPQGARHAAQKRSQANPHRGLGAHHHRPGLRVRLFRHASRQGSQGGWLRCGAGEFQSRHHHDRSGTGRSHVR